MNKAKQHNLEACRLKVEQERIELIALKKSGKYNLFNYLDQHPVGALVNKGIRLSDEHPLMKLNNKKPA